MIGVVVVGITKNKKTILVVGCSHTHHSGFTDSNQEKYHWPWLLSRHYDCYFQNAGLEGSSNEEIFCRAVEILSEKKFALVVVMWSGIGRYWIYPENNNIDDYIALGLGVKSTPTVEEYTKLTYAYFNNQYIDVKKWLLKILALENFCKNKQQPFVFVKSFENYIRDFIAAEYSESNKFTNIEPVKHMLDFDNRPDHYIADKLQRIKQLITAVDQSKWVNFTTDAFWGSDYTLDLADDQAHPGILTNKKMYLDLVDYFDAHKIFG